MKYTFNNCLVVKHNQYSFSIYENYTDLPTFLRDKSDQYPIRGPIYVGCDCVYNERSQTIRLLNVTEYFKFVKYNKNTWKLYEDFHDTIKLHPYATNIDLYFPWYSLSYSRWRVTEEYISTKVSCDLIVGNVAVVSIHH